MRDLRLEWRVQASEPPVSTARVPWIGRAARPIVAATRCTRAGSARSHRMRSRWSRRSLTGRPSLPSFQLCSSSRLWRPWTWWSSSVERGRRRASSRRNQKKKSWGTSTRLATRGRWDSFDRPEPGEREGSRRFRRRLLKTLFFS